MAVYSLPAQPPLRPPVIDVADLSGEDVAFTTGMTVGPHGDWLTVANEDAARQSVIREHLARAGALARRPEWGIGAVDAVFRNMNQKELAALAARSRKRMTRNPRVARLVEVQAFKLDGANGVADVPGGIALRVEFVPVGTQKPTTVVIKPPGVR